MITFFACNKNDGPGNGDCFAFGSQEYLNRINPVFDELTAAGIAWSNDPSDANCERYRAAYIEYADVFDSYTSCWVGWGYTQEAVNEWKKEIQRIKNTSDCNDL